MGAELSVCFVSAMPDTLSRKWSDAESVTAKAERSLMSDSLMSATASGTASVALAVMTSKLPPATINNS